MSDADDTGPLGGLRVIDVTPLLPGPFCTQILADLGADVIRVEPPRGDHSRSMPSGLHAVTNRNKRSVVLDLRDPAAQKALHTLLRRADVLVEGFRPGVAARLGMDPFRLMELNERLVFCSISGFGADGADRLASGHDLVYLAAGGALAYSGHWGETPRRSGLPVSDLATSAYAAVAILAALHERERTGSGCRLDLSITDVATTLTSVRAGPQFSHRDEDRLHQFPVNDLFISADGAVLAISAVEDHFWRRLRRVLAARAPEINDPKYDDDRGRRRHGDDLHRLVARVISTEPAGLWLQELRAADVPVQRVLTGTEALAAARERGRDVAVQLDGEWHVPFPARRNGRPLGRVRHTARALGADTRSVLLEAGVSKETVDALALASQDSCHGE